MNELHANRIRNQNLLNQKIIFIQKNYTWKMFLLHLESFL